MRQKVGWITLILVMAGCAAPQKNTPQQADLFVEFGRHLDIARQKVDTDSPWLSNRAVALNIVGPVYSTKAKQNSAANRMLDAVLNTLAADRSRMNQLTGIDFDLHFGSVTRLEYESDDDTFTYIPALVKNAFADEAALNAVFETTAITRKSGAENAEIGFYVDENAWQNKVIRLSGYKTIKIAAHQRNSVWFRLERPMPQPLTAAAVQNELASMVVYALNSSIREYASIDRGKVMLHSAGDFILQSADGEVDAYLYRDRKKLLAQEQQKRIENLDKERFLIQTSGAVATDIDDALDKLLLVRQENYVNSVVLLSMKNANQRQVIYRSNSWDERVQQAFYFAQSERVVIVTDKQLLFYELAQDKPLRTIKGDYQQQRFIVDRASQQVLAPNGNQVMRYSSAGQTLTPISVPGEVRSIALDARQQALFYLSASGELIKISLKTGKNYAITQLAPEFQSLQLCQGNTALVAYNTTSLAVIADKVQSVAKIYKMPSALQALDCDSRKDKLLLVYKNGAVEQRQLFDWTQQQFALSMNYSGYDQQNSHYIVAYLAGDYFIYGGRDNLRIRSSTSADEVRRHYASLKSKVTLSADWLDQQTIDQAVYITDLTAGDKQLYQQLFSRSRAPQTGEQQAFLREETLDPILLSNQVDGFNALGMNLILSQEPNLKIVRHSRGDVELSASSPDLERLGYHLNLVKLGYHGFSAKVYQSFASTGLAELSTNILNVAISDDGESLLLMRSDGRLTVRKFASGAQVVLPLAEHGIRAAALAKDNRQLVIVTKGGILQWFDVTFSFDNKEPAQIKLKQTMQSYAGNVSQISFIGPGVAMTAGQDQTIKIWDLKRGTVRGSDLLGHTDVITRCHFNASLEQIVSAGLDGTIRIWNPDSHEQIFSFKGAGKPFLAAIDDESNTVAYRHGQQMLVRNLITRDKVGEVALAGNDAQAAALGYAANVLYIAYPDRLEARRVSTGALIATVPFAKPYQLQQLLVDPEYRNLVLVEADDIHLINIGRFQLESLRGLQ